MSERLIVSQAGNAAPPRAASPAEISRLLASDPAAAEARARETLTAQPQNADALLVLAAALRRQGRAAEARAILEPIVASQPDSAFAQLELGLSLGLLNERPAALDALARAVDLAPTYMNAWCALGDELARMESDASGAPSRDEAATKNLHAADAALARRNFPEADALLARALEGSPDFQPARFRHAIVLLAQDRAHLALPVIEELIRRDPGTAFYRELKASALYEVGDFHRAIVHYEELLNDGRERPGAWISYGRALRAIGREKECLAAFWKAVEILPAFAQGWRTLATVKTAPLAPATIAQLRGLLAQPVLLLSTRMQLHFALAKALDDAGNDAEAFENYRLSNELQNRGRSGTAEGLVALGHRTKAVFTREFFRARAQSGCADEGPIFVVGMLRAGSTLVQEILAGHSAIERTGELRELPNMMMRLGASAGAGAGGASRFPEAVGPLDHDRLRALGEEYLARTRPRRKTGLPFFVDKLPGNFMYTGLIHLILPNARIIDVRRHPLDCCVSCFTNYFPEGPQWSHSLGDLGRIYAGYVEVMAHFDAVLPGRVHRVIYEELVREPEKEVRRLLDYVGLPFEEGCLRFYEKEQEIVTTSIEQARRPIYESGMGSSRRFEPWLGPLKQALSTVLDAYPEVPTFYPHLRASMTMRIA
jgi:tetratricopeptide (TPR) repeat protein